VVVDELIDLAFPSKYPGLTRIHHLRSVPDSNVADWRDDQRQVMSAIVRFGFRNNFAFQAKKREVVLTVRGQERASVEPRAGAGAGGQAPEPVGLRVRAHKAKPGTRAGHRPTGLGAELLIQKNQKGGGCYSYFKLTSQKAGGTPGL
jgi:hypothetical protein